MTHSSRISDWIYRILKIGGGENGGRESNFIEVLDDPSCTTWANELGTELLRVWETYEPTHGAAHEMFRMISWLVPFGPKVGDTPDPRTFKNATGIHVSQEEWETFLSLSKDKSKLQPGDLQNPRKWWDRHQQKLGDFYFVATFLLCVPPVVTHCDSVLSLDSCLFSVQQSRLNR
jgi:hypothetical protein